MNEFLGGPVLPTLLRIIVACIVVGVIMSVLNINPLSLWDHLLGLVMHVWNMGFSALDGVWRYFLLGAIVVLPVWLVIRLLNMLGGRSRD